MVNQPLDATPALRMTEVEATPWFLGADLTVAAGQCVALVADAAAAEHFGDLVQGLLAPARGAVAVCGRDWQALSARATYALRARIGRVAPSMHWIQNLNVDENVILPMLDRTRLAESEIRAQAAALAHRLGLDELPRSRPHATSQSDLTACAAVRAFLGAPALVLVEPVPTATPAALRAGLLELAIDACANGAGVLWLDTAPAPSELPPGPRGTLARAAFLRLDPPGGTA